MNDENMGNNPNMIFNFQHTLHPFISSGSYSITIEKAVQEDIHNINIAYLDQQKQSQLALADSLAGASFSQSPKSSGKLTYPSYPEESACGVLISEGISIRTNTSKVHDNVRAQLKFMRLSHSG
eukprot:399613_1